jgi:hypothetical protein
MHTHIIRIIIVIIIMLYSSEILNLTRPHVMCPWTRFKILMYPGFIIIIFTYKTHKKPLRIQQHPASASTATLKNSTWTGRGQASSTA